MYTNHAYQRCHRLDFIESVIGIGNPVRKFYIDRGHKDGPEIHIVTTTGIIAIFNAITSRFITALIARPGQIQRYYDAEHIVCPKYLLDLALEHQKAGFNRI